MEQEKGVQIFPDYQVKAHIARMMSECYDLGLLCPVSINVAQARMLLKDMRLPELMAADIDDVKASIELAKSKGKTWAPWHLTDVLARKRGKAYEVEQAQKRIAVGHRLSDGIAHKNNVTLGVDSGRAYELMYADKKPERHKKMLDVQKLTGNAKMTVWKAYLWLAEQERTTNKKG